MIVFLRLVYTSDLPKAMRCHGVRVPSPYLYLYGGSMIVIPTSVTVASTNARTCSYVLVRTPTWPIPNLIDWARRLFQRERICLCLIEFISVGKAVFRANHGPRPSASVFRSASMGFHRIADWRVGGESTHKSVSFLYSSFIGRIDI